MSNEADTLGLMAGVAFVAHCLLNQNAKVYGGARCPGIYSPLVDSVVVVRKGKVRRAKLYYLRGLRGKSARISERQEHGGGEEAAAK